MDEKPKDDDEVISASIAGHTIPVARSQVRWVETQRNFVRLHTDKQSYLWREPLSHLEKRWNRHGFVRIHRAYLVYLPLVTELPKRTSGYSARIGSGSDAVDLPVSRRQFQKFKRLWKAQKEH